MKYQNAVAFRTAIEARLKLHAREHGQVALMRMRRQIVFDRFLDRLNAIDPGNWTLKGGLALDYRFGDRARATQDIDLLHDRDMDRIDEVFSAMEVLEQPDFFEFEITRTNKLDRLIEGSAVRYHIQANLAGRVFERIVVDIGFDRTPTMRTERVARSGFLQFAGVESVAFPALAMEFHLAEKLHAYCRIYSSEGRTSTRVKDLVDMVLIGRSITIEATLCSEAIHQTFESRRVIQVPSSLGEPPSEWTVPYRALALSVGLDPDIRAGHAYAASLFDPLLAGGLPPDARWSHHERRWM